MKGILFQLAGPIASWGAPSIGDNREVYRFPTTSAVLGLIGCCCGIDHRDEKGLEALFNSWDVASMSLKEIRIAGRSTIRTSIAYDFHTTRDSLLLNGELNKNPVLGYKGLQFQTLAVVALTLRESASPNWLDWTFKGLNNPVFTPYLGRVAQPCSEWPRPEKIDNFSLDLLEKRFKKILEEKTDLPPEGNDVAYRALQLWPAEWETKIGNGQALISVADRRVGHQKIYAENHYWQREVAGSLGHA